MEVAKESLQNSHYYPFFWFLQVFSLPFKKNSVNLHSISAKHRSISALSPTVFAFLTSQGEVLEWLKRHAWKACKRQKRFGGSNPPLSAKGKSTKGFPFFDIPCVRGFLFCTNGFSPFSCGDWQEKLHFLSIKQI